MKKSHLLNAVFAISSCLVSVTVNAAYIISTSTTKGSIEILSTAPANLEENQFVGDSDPAIDILRIFQEQSNLSLKQDVTVDIDASKLSAFPAIFTGGVAEPPPSTSGILSAGSNVVSFFFHLDEPTNELGQVEGSVTFNVDILAIVTDSDTLLNTHSVLGSLGTTYTSVAANHGTLEDNNDYIRFTSFRTLEFQVSQQSGMDQFRVIVAFPVGTSTFDLSNEGWKIADPVPTSHFGSQAFQTIPIPWDNTVGLPPGSILAEDIHGFTWDWITAPSHFIGDYSVEYGNDITFDIQLGTYPSINPGPAVALEGSTMTLFYNMPPTIRDTWATRTVPLTEIGWVVNNYENGTTATQANMLEVLGNLKGFYILAEWRVGNDSTHVDNVLFGSANLNPPILAPFPWNIFMPAILHGGIRRSSTP